MNRKYLKSLLVLALVVPCLVLLSACGGAAGGFSSQKALIEAAFDMDVRSVVSEAGLDTTVPSFDSTMRFIDTSNSSIMVEALRNSYNKNLEQLKKDVALMKAGNYQLRWNSSGDGSWDVLSKANYDKALAAAKAEAASYKITKAPAIDEVATKALQNTTAFRNRTVEVWTFEWEYQPYNYDIFGDLTDATFGEKDGEVVKVTTGPEARYQLEKIGNKWYMLGGLGGFGGFGGGD